MGFLRPQVETWPSGTHQRRRKPYSLGQRSDYPGMDERRPDGDDQAQREYRDMIEGRATAEEMDEYIYRQYEQIEEMDSWKSD